MSIYDELQKTHLKDGKRKHHLANQLRDFGMFRRFLAESTEPADMVALLYLELQGANRFSYISRIYGRYRKLLPDRDRSQMQQWRQEKCAKK